MMPSRTAGQSMRIAIMREYRFAAPGFGSAAISFHTARSRLFDAW